MGNISWKHDHPTPHPTKPKPTLHPTLTPSQRKLSLRGTGSRKLETPRSGRVAKCRGCPPHLWFFVIFFSVNRLVFYLVGEMLVGIGFQGMDRVMFRVSWRAKPCHYLLNICDNATWCGKMYYLCLNQNT
jgi:hypothetical protein